MTTIYTARKNYEAAQAVYDAAVRRSQTQAQKEALARLRAAKHALLVAELRGL